MKINLLYGTQHRPTQGDFVSTVLIELQATKDLKRIPANVLFLIDGSSSMGGSKWNSVKQAVSELVEHFKDEDRVGVIVFDSSSKEIFPLASLRENRDAMKQALDKLGQPSGVTNLEAGLKLAYAAFNKRDEKDKLKRVNHIILLTDGFPTDPQGYRLDETSVFEKYVKNEESVTLTGIGIGTADEYDSNFISRLSDLGRGSFYHANDLNKFREGLKAEVAKLDSSVVGDLQIAIEKINGKVMRFARVAPEITVYDIGSAQGKLDVSVGSMTQDKNTFLVQIKTSAQGQSGDIEQLFRVRANFDGNWTEYAEAHLTLSENASDFSQISPDVLRALQVFQVHLGSEQIQLALESGEREKAQKIIENTTKIASRMGQDKVTKVLTKMAQDLHQGKSVSDQLATIKDESKKTRLIMPS